MCGIFGYIGNKQALRVLLSGLKALEYRGYDSSGIYIAGQGCIKAIGQVQNLESKLSYKKLIDGTVGIAHTRWATHGKPTEINAHPHTGVSERVWVVHNGVIENYVELKREFEEIGNVFTSDTDSEVIPQSIEFYLKDNSIEYAITKTLKKLKGSYALVIADTQAPDTLFVVKKGSPLVIGIGKEEIFISSDIQALAEYTNKTIFLEDNEMGILKKTPLGVKYAFLDVSGTSAKNIYKEFSWLDVFSENTQKGEYEHYMLKEIMEEPEVVKRAMKNRINNNEIYLAELEGYDSILKNIEQIIIIGCGTAYYSGMIASYFLDEYTGIPVKTDIASEFRYKKNCITKNTLVIALSQSGETADTFEAIKEAKKNGALTLGIINAQNSTISREVDICIYNYAGAEIGVASTKAFVSQVTVLTLFAGALLKLKHGPTKDLENIIQELMHIPKKIEKILREKETIKSLAEAYAENNNFLYLGRKYHYPIALEGALKLKEISYIHAEGYSSGEMKHGPLAMIDEDFPSVMVIPKDTLYEKNISTLQEIKARNGNVVAIITEGDEKTGLLADDVFSIPKTHEVLAPLLSCIPLQLFSYYIANFKGLNIDKPRNLAKSVTVE